MNLLFVSSGLSSKYGGSAISESSLASEMKRFGSVRVICPIERLDSGFAANHGVGEAKSFSRLEVLTAWFNPSHWLREWISDSGVIHLNGHWRWENYFLVKMARGSGIPVIFHPRGMCLVGHRKVFLKKVFNALIGNQIINIASKIIVLSEFETRQLIPYGVPAQKIVVIPNGIPVHEKLMPEARPDSVAVGKKYFLFLGRLEARKNIIFLLEALAEYIRRGGEADLVCMGPVEREYDVKIRKKSKSLKIDGRVHLMPPVYDDRKRAFMRGALAVVYPSYGEPFGRVPFEAVASGAYPVVPDQSGGAEYLSLRLAYSTFKLGDPNDLAERFLVLEKAKGLEEEIQKAREWIKMELNWKTISQRVYELYKSTE